jgi:lysozyme
VTITANQSAFLTLVSHSEGTFLAADAYRCCYAFRHTIADLSYHPAVLRPNGTREWAGESLASLGPQYEGEVSTAAGRYQMNKHWWLVAQGACGLPDFSPASQDAAALWLIKQNQALALIDAGQIAEAIHRCRGIWASFPGGNSGQPEAALSACLGAFTNAGGLLAA